jgi:hypothetical protein
MPEHCGWISLCSIDKSPAFEDSSTRAEKKPFPLEPLSLQPSWDLHEITGEISNISKYTTFISGLGYT